MRSFVASSAVGIHDTPGHINWTSNNIGINTQHFVRNAQTWSDPHLGLIGTQYPGLGSYIGELGNTSSGGDAAMLNYCFTVDANDPILRFVYAVILRYAVEHAPNVQSFFQWTVYRNDGQPIGAGNIIGAPFRIVADLDNPYFHITGQFADIVYKGWTCEEIDLSDYIGENVCIQFITSDCQETVHPGYAYIDGLCSTPEELAPTINIEDIPKFCLNEVIPITVTGNGFNRYSWRISKLDENGQECCVETIEEIGEDASIEDLKDYYEDNSNHDLGCGKIKIEVTAYNDCGGIVSDEAEVTILCSNYNVDYCNLIPICDYFSNQQILGQIDCEDCSFTWSPSQYLNFVNGNQAQPWIELVEFPHASEETYHVIVKSPTGCQPHEEDIKLVDLSLTEMVFEKNVSHCDYEVIVTVDTKFDIPNEYVIVQLEETVGNDFYNMHLDASASSGSIKVFKYTIMRDHNTFLYAHASIDLSFFGDCTTESVCNYSLTIGTEPKSNYLGAWRVYLPNVFSPNGDGINDIWSPFPAGHSIECEHWDDEPSEIYNNIYGMKVSVWDRSGGLQLQWQNQLFRGVYDSEGILSSDFQWDGTGFNGLPLQSGVYVVVVEIWSCFGTAGYNSCFYYCPCMPEGQGPHPHPCDAYCNESSHETITIDVTIIR